MVLLGLCVMVLDVGRVEALSLQLQTAAGSAAVSYALEAGRRGDVPTADFTAMANAEVAAYATANHMATPTLTLQSGASSGPYAGNNAVIQATVQQTVPSMLLSLFSTGNSVNVSRTAVATMPPCATFYTTLQLTSGTHFLLNCPVAVGTSLTVDATSQVTGSTLVYGAAPASSISGAVVPSPLYNWPSETHPDSYATYTTGGSCQATNLNLNNTVTTLSPGFYCNSSTITNSTVTLQPGFYTLQGGLTLTNSTVLGGPATLVFEKNSSNLGQVLLSNSIWRVNAPVAPYGTGLAAILFACVVPIGGTNYWGINDMQISGTTVVSDGIISCGLVGTTITNSILGDDGHFFSVVFSRGSIAGTTLTTTDDYSLLPGGSPHSYTVNVLQ